MREDRRSPVRRNPRRRRPHSEGAATIRTFQVRAKDFGRRHLQNRTPVSLTHRRSHVTRHPPASRSAGSSSVIAYGSPPWMDSRFARPAGHHLRGSRPVLATLPSSADLRPRVRPVQPGQPRQLHANGIAAALEFDRMKQGAPADASIPRGFSSTTTSASSSTGSTRKRRNDPRRIQVRGARRLPRDQLAL